MATHARRTATIALAVMTTAMLGVVATDRASAAAETQACPTTPAGLVSLWSGEQSAADLYGTNDATAQGGVGYVPGKYGHAFDFDGVDDALLVPASPSLALDSAFTLEFWFSFTDDVLPGSPRQIQGTTFLNKGWDDFFGFANGLGFLELGFDQPRLLSTTSAWQANTWHHTAVTFDAGLYRLYVDGVLEASLARPRPLLGELQDIYFSHSLATPWNPPAWHRQRLDEIAIYDRALAASEVAGRAGSCAPTYNFDGFFEPVDNLPVLNTMTANRAVPLKFSLGGDQGLAVFADGYPKSEAIACDSTAPVDGVEETVAAGSSSLTYDAVTQRYKYVWKTNSAWTDTCRQLVVKLSDGSLHRANFKFK